MEDFLYAYNQPKKFGKYDLILDGKIIANEVVYKVLTEDNDIETINLADKIKELESKSQNSFTFETVTELPTEGKESVIYLVPNGDTSDDENSYYEYLWDKTNSKFELIGSGSYEQQKAELDKEIADRIADVNAEEERAKDAEQVLTDNLAKEIKDRTDADTLIRETVTSITGYPFEKITGDTLSISDELEKRVPYTLHKDVNVVGNVKDVVKLDVPESSNEAMYCPQGLIMGGSAQAAGLVTRGICGVSNPADDGYCLKENLYINYDGDTTYRNNRQLILQAGEVGDDYGHNLYQFAAARGDAVKGYVDEKIENRVVINDPITITEGDNTTSITSDTISTTTLTGTLDAESMKNSLTAEAIQNVAPIAWKVYETTPTATGHKSVAIGNDAKAKNSYGLAIGSNSIAQYEHDVAIGFNAQTLYSYSTAIGSDVRGNKNRTVSIGAGFAEETNEDGSVKYFSCKNEGTGSITIGAGANTLNTTKTVDGVETTVESSNSITIGCKAENKGADSVVIGASSQGTKKASVVVGAGARGIGDGESVAVGNSSVGSTKAVSVGQNSVAYTNCVSIGNMAKTSTTNTTVIGSGATVIDTGDTPSMNSTVIGYGASASAPNVVVLGTGATAGTANTFAEKTVTIGVGATTLYREAIAIGHNAKSTSFYSIGLGGSTVADGNGAFALGFGAESHSIYSTAIGTYAKAKNDGVVVFASFDNASMTTKTQLYFSGANTPLANEYYNGEAMMGYTVTDSAGTVLACGTRRLSELFPDNSLTQPATTDENGELVMPKVFHPSDLDLPIEEPSENNDVEINIPIIETPIEEEYKPLPIYPIVEPTIDEITE